MSSAGLGASNSSNIEAVEMLLEPNGYRVLWGTSGNVCSTQDSSLNLQVASTSRLRTTSTTSLVASPSGKLQKACVRIGFKIHFLDILAPRCFARSLGDSVVGNVAGGKKMKFVALILSGKNVSPQVYNRSLAGVFLDPSSPLVFGYLCASSIENFSLRKRPKRLVQENWELRIHSDFELKARGESWSEKMVTCQRK